MRLRMVVWLPFNAKAHCRICGDPDPYTIRSHLDRVRVQFLDSLWEGNVSHRNTDGFVRSNGMSGKDFIAGMRKL